MTHADREKRNPPSVKRHARRDGADAFFPESSPHTGDALAENLAQEYLESATSGEERGEEALNELVSEEIGGPFIETSSALEPDELAPRTREPGRRVRRRKRH
jgi:hypothetical protein